MNQKTNFLQQLTLLFVLFGAFTGLYSCDDDDVSTPLTLQYMSVENIGTGMYCEIAPYYCGATPTDFTIQKIKLNGEVTETSGFAIDATTGVVSTEVGNRLAAGKYTLTISCHAGGTPVAFEDILTITMLDAAPAVIRYKEPVITFEYGYLDTAYIAEIGESVTLKSFVLDEEGDGKYFQIDASTGMVTLNPKNDLFEPYPGHYHPKVGVVTNAGTFYYDNVLEFNITSLPLSLNYEVDSLQIEQNGSDTSFIPVYKGSPDELVYSIKSVTPETPNQAKFRIDPATGRIYVEKDNALEVNTYHLSVTATNKYGNKDFDNIFKCNVIAFIEPIENFAYEAATVNRTKAVQIAKADGFKGGYVTFELAEPLAPALADYINLDRNTGEITAPKGNKIPIGNYTIKVRAKNSKAPEGVVATLNLTVVEHENAFTLVYGNNLGLTPAENYANQYSFTKTLQDTTISPVAVPQNTTFRIADLFSGNSKSHQNTGGKFEADIDANTGALNIKATGLGAGAMAYVLVEATKGSGEDAYTVQVPVFIQSRNNDNANPYNFSPFVFQVNPKTGGVSTTPILNDATAAVGDQFKVDLKDQMAYLDLSDAEHIGQAGSKWAQLSTQGTTDVSNSGMLKTLWDEYYKVFGKAVSYGDKNPISGISNFDSMKAYKLCYIDQADHKVYVNPEIWKDANGNYANGIFWARATYQINGKDPSASGSKAVFPFVIWFSTDFK